MICLVTLTSFVQAAKSLPLRKNYVLYAVENEKAMMSGPAFLFKDVNYYDLHLIGENQPDSFGMGIHCRVNAEVEGYEDGFVILDPVSIEVIEVY